MKVSELPPGRLIPVSRGTSLAQVAKRMRTNDCDAVAVMSEKKLVGIITERDLVRAIADGVDPRQARAHMFMSADPATVRADEDASVVAVKMMALGIRHLPVVDAKGAPVGLISASDLVGMMEKGRAAG